MKNKMNNTQTMIAELKERYSERANRYEMILKNSGMELEQVLTLLDIYDIVELTGVFIPIIESKRDLYEAIKADAKGMCLKAMSHVDKESAYTKDLFLKSMYVGEIESDEIKKTIIGYYMALCASELVPYLFFKLEQTFQN